MYAMTELESYTMTQQLDRSKTHAHRKQQFASNEWTNKRTNDLVIRPDSVFNFHYSSTGTTQHNPASLFFNYISTERSMCECMTIAIAILHGYVHFVALTLRLTHNTEIYVWVLCSLCASAAGALCVEKGQNHSRCAVNHMIKEQYWLFVVLLFIITIWCHCCCCCCVRFYFFSTYSR